MFDMTFIGGKSHGMVVHGTGPPEVTIEGDRYKLSYAMGISEKGEIFYVLKRAKRHETKPIGVHRYDRRGREMWDAGWQKRFRRSALERSDYRYRTLKFRRR